MPCKLYKQIILDNIVFPYSISRDGEVISLNYNHTNTVKHRKLSIDKDGYKWITLNLNGKKYKYRINRLVAMVYIPIPKKYLKQGLWYDDLVVNHKDGNKANDHVKNLEWCTNKENIQHAYRIGLKKPKKGVDHPMSKYTEKQIRKVCKLLEENKIPMKKISEKTDVDIYTVFNIYDKKIWTVISDEYDVSNFSVKSDRRTNCKLRKYDIKTIKKICKLLEKGDMTMKEISKELGVSTGLIENIKYGRIYTDISKDYTFKRRKHK